MTAQQFLWVAVGTTATERIDQLRHSGVRLALAMLADGWHDDALDVLRRSVEQQALLAGCGRVSLP